MKIPNPRRESKVLGGGGVREIFWGNKIWGKVRLFRVLGGTVVVRVVIWIVFRHFQHLFLFFF